MKLSEKQQKFTHMVALLILHAEQLGYRLTFGDAYRSPQVSYGHENSLHRKRLAVDLNLFKDGTYLTKTEDYMELGAYWESLDEDASWGGRFDDGNHFSLKHDGMR